MNKELTAKEIALLFNDNMDNDFAISKVFDVLEFDCSVRKYIDPAKLESSIKNFNAQKNVDNLVPIIELIQNAKKSVGVDEKGFLVAVKQYILDHLSENISVEQIAGTFYISYYYLCHLFKEHVKKSLNLFRTHKRLEKAAKLLLETEQKITDIATACGFDNVSYFSESFLKHLKETPTDFRKKYHDLVILDTYELEDILLAMKMPRTSFLESVKEIGDGLGVEYVKVHNPGEEFGLFLHEAAIIEFNGVLYASWYNCKDTELVGYTPIVERRSYDNGKTWTDAQIVCEDKSQKILYCPPVYGISDGKLYMFVNQMVAADYMHSLDLYVLNQDTDKFDLVWSKPIPFKLNTNLIKLPNGKLLLPGRIGEFDGFPVTPAVMISDSGKIDGEWRVVSVAKDGVLPDGESLIYPETTVSCCEDTLYMFNRNDCRRVPLVYISKDYGETWSEVYAHDIPYVSSKIYAGELNDDRHYLIANILDEERSKLVLYLTSDKDLKFTNSLTLIDCAKGGDIKKCHYPCAIEKDKKLYIIATAEYITEESKTRGAVLFTVDLENI